MPGEHNLRIRKVNTQIGALWKQHERTIIKRRRSMVLEAQLLQTGDEETHDQKGKRREMTLYLQESQIGRTESQILGKGRESEGSGAGELNHRKGTMIDRPDLN